MSAVPTSAGVGQGSRKAAPLFPMPRNQQERVTPTQEPGQEALGTFPRLTKAWRRRGRRALTWAPAEGQGAANSGAGTRFGKTPAEKSLPAVPAALRVQAAPAARRRCPRRPPPAPVLGAPKPRPRPSAPLTIMVVDADIRDAHCQAPHRRTGHVRVARLLIGHQIGRAHV